MVKSRFSSLDVRAMVNSIRPSVVGCKLTNVYDINSRVYLLKLARRGFKCFLLLESGVRFHLTSYTRDKSEIPSNYTMKLRKHIRTRRLSSIEQLGCDRCIDITFGWGESAYHLILELYVSGNLILCDHEYKILALLRAHNDQQKVVSIRQTYPLGSATGLLMAPVSDFPQTIDHLLNLAGQRQETQEIGELEREDEKAKEAARRGELSAFQKRSKKRVNHSAFPLVQLLHKLAPFADPALCASCLAKTMQADGRECPKPFQVTIDDMSFEEVVSTLQATAERILDTLRSVSRPSDLGGGHMPTLQVPDQTEEHDDGDEADDDDVEAKQADVGAPAEAEQQQPQEADGAAAPAIPGWILKKRIHVPPEEVRWANEEFTPLQPAQGLEPEAFTAYPTFHQCVDEFFIQVEEHKAVEQKAQHAQNVYAKVERIRADQGRRVEQLEAEQESAERQAQVIEANVEIVERALAMVNTMIASQVDWGELWREVKRQRRVGHPLAQHIHSLDLERNEMTLVLCAQPEEEEDGEGDRPMEVVPLDLSLTPHANVARLHARRKETREKTSRTLTAAEAAIKQAERKAQQDLQKFQLKQTIRRVRQTWWFEKFIWFISSENYLVLAGHDSTQLEQIFCRHLGPHDVFVQADVAGAKTCFIRNPEGREVPPATLREAGTTALCHSTAWDKRMVISAWWAPVAAVSRGAPPAGGAAAAGDYVLVDGFYVQGRRNFMPPLHLEMGLTLLFHVSEACAARHSGERRSRYFEAIGAASGTAAREGSGSNAEDAAAGAGDGNGSNAGEEEAVVAAGGTAPGGTEEAPPPAEDPASNAGGEDGIVSGAAVEQGEAPSAANAEAAEAVEAEASASEGEAELENATEEAEEHAEAVEERGRSERSRISRAERRRRKAGGMTEGGEPDTCKPAAVVPGGAKAKAEAKAKPAPGQAPLPRGQRAKAKKVKEKYGDQDSEERELRLALLGSKATKYLANGGALATDAPKIEPGAAAVEPAPRPARPESDAAPRGAAAPQEAGAGPLARPQPAGEAAAPRPEQRRRGGGGAAARPEGVALRAGCEVDADAPAHEQQLARLDVLTGQPQPDDEVLYLLPMVAPYCSLGGHYTYRVKLTPGSIKKGQAAKQCLSIFQAQLDRLAWKQLLQAVQETEAASLLCGACKLSTPGLQKLQNQVKKGRQKEMRGREKEEASAGK